MRVHGASPAPPAAGAEVLPPPPPPPGAHGPPRLPGADALPPPPADQLGVVPWDGPIPLASAIANHDTTSPRASKAPEAGHPAPAPDRPVRFAGVHLSGRTAGFVDSAYEIGRSVRDHPIASLALVGASVALGVAAPGLALGVSVALLGIGVGGAIGHEAKGSRARTETEREHERRATGQCLFLAVSSVPLRGLRGASLLKK